jgi:hypothetical protein
MLLITGRETVVELLVVIITQTKFMALVKTFCFLTPIKPVSVGK